MHPMFCATVKAVNKLMEVGYDLSKLPDFTTNAGWKLTYSVHDVPNKVGLILTKDFDYVLLVGRIEGNILVDVEEEASDDSWLNYFYAQIEVYINKTLMHVPKVKPGVVHTWVELKEIENGMLANMWRKLPRRVDIHQKIFIHGTVHELEVHRSWKGNGVINVTHRDGNHFYVQFECDQVRSFKTRGFTRSFALSKMGELIKHCY